MELEIDGRQTQNDNWLMSIKSTLELKDLNVFSLYLCYFLLIFFSFSVHVGGTPGKILDFYGMKHCWRWNVTK